MKRVWALGVLAVLGFAAAGRGQAVEVFNGKDLSGWKFVGKAGSAPASDENGWSVKDGVMHCAGKPGGYLRTDKAFGPNYELTVEYRYVKPGNSGLLVAITGEDKVWPRSIEPQIKPGETGDLFGMGGLRLHVDPKRSEIRGGNERTKRTAAKEAEKPDGWNTYVVKLYDGMITQSVNGIAENAATGAPTEPGGIGICAEGAELEVRKVSVKAIEKPVASAAAEARRLDGLPGWHISGNSNWSMKDGVIEGRQSKDVKTYTHLVTDQSYKDLHATFKFKAVQGNSGFYFRVKEDELGRMHGFQAEIDEKRDDGGLYESYHRGWVSKPAAEDVAKYFKVGDWNEMDVDVVGDHIVVKVNGTVASDIHDYCFAAEGPCALQVHGGQDVDVLFKDIVIEGK